MVKSILSAEEILEIHNHIEFGNDLSDDLFTKLYEYYVNSGEMPYGTAKARTGDPHDWIYDKLESEFS